MFEERERLFTLHEGMCGARMHNALFTYGGMNYDVSIVWFAELSD
jgi:NADH:ubiquinone oxidoreductase subunit D